MTKIAYVHILPLEYYPPATNTLTLIAGREGSDVRAWTSPNQRGLREWSAPNVPIVRHPYTEPGKAAHGRLLTYLRWHINTARELARWKPDAIISVEPHSAIAVWIYFNILGQRSRLFIHHHEYYAREDFRAPGMRLVRVASRLEARYLFRRAEWVSQTNQQRLEMIARDANLNPRVAHVLPNYPPRHWVERASRARSEKPSPLRLIYLGSASLKDSFIFEAARWVAEHRGEVSLTVVGNNISSDVWAALERLQATNIFMNPWGWDYDDIPEQLEAFDVGLVLYRGNTQNFVFNVPNKAIEYLVSGLEVWYPPQMKSMERFHSEHPPLPLTMIDFERLPGSIPERADAISEKQMLAFTAESALEPLLAQLDRGPHHS